MYFQSAIRHVSENHSLGAKGDYVLALRKRNYFQKVSALKKRSASTAVLIALAGVVKFAALRTGAAVARKRPVENGSAD